MVIGLRLIALLSREEMEKRLRESEVGCDDYVVEKLFPALLRHAGEELYANGVAMMLLFATNFNATITPQGSSCNAIYLSSGYISAREIYIYGGAITLLNLVIFLAIGTPWILAVAHL